MFVTGLSTSSSINSGKSDADAFIHSVDITNGVSNWIQYWGGTGTEEGIALAVSPDGGKILVTGQ